jgi:hypothetical protein
VAEEFHLASEKRWTAFQYWMAYAQNAALLILTLHAYIDVINPIQELTKMSLPALNVSFILYTLFYSQDASMSIRSKLVPRILLSRVECP